MKNLRLGLIGCGRHMSEVLWPSIKLQDGVTVTHVTSQTGKTAEAFAQSHFIPNVSQSFFQWDQSSLDAIVCSGPVQLHEEVAAFALKQRIPVFVEKPVARDLEQLNLLIGLQNLSKSVIQVGYNLRFSSTVEAFRTSSEELSSEPLHIDYHTNKPTSELWGLQSLLQSFLLAIAVHPLNLAAAIRGPIRTVRISRRHYDQTEISLEIQITHQNGMESLVRTSNLARKFELKLQVGSLEKFVMPDLRTIQRVLLNEGVETVYSESLLKPVNSGSGFVQQMSRFMSAARGEVLSNSDLSSSIWMYELFEELMRGKNEVKNEHVV